MRIFTSVLLVATLLLSACANPVVVPPLRIEEHAKDCDAIAKDISQTRHFKDAARDEDGFQWKYIFVVNALVSAYRINEAETAAEERLAELERMAANKDCKS
ncbi:MAG: hypothetical protein ACPG80_01435 [Rickettsiales bacterium]